LLSWETRSSNATNQRPVNMNMNRRISGKIKSINCQITSKLKVYRADIKNNNRLDA
jgi:hypothetical protein